MSSTLIVTYNTNRSGELYFEELYNLGKDPKELQNVSEVRSNQQALNRLRKIALNEINLSKINQSAL